MYSLSALLVLLCGLVLALAEPRLQQQPQLAVAANRVGVAGQHPYLFLSVPRGRSGAVVQGFEIIEDANEDDDDDDEGQLHDDDGDDFEDDDADDNAVNNNGNLASLKSVIFAKQGARFADNRQNSAHNNNKANGDVDEDEEDDVEETLNDDDDDDENDAPVRSNQVQKIIKNAKPTHMMVAREHAGAIMVPDGIIEIEGQSVVDEKTGKAALLVPRAALDAIPDGSVVALMERSTGLVNDDEEEEERANRVIVRRRRKGARRNVRRRRGNSGTRRRRGGNNKRRRGGNNKRNNVRVIRTGGNKNNRRRGVRRGGSNAAVRPVVIQG